MMNQHTSVGGGVRAALVLHFALMAPAVALAQTEGSSPASEVFASPVDQTPVTVYELVLRDGSRVYGTVERQDDQEVVFRTQAGATVTARREDIQSLRKITGTVVNGEFLRPDPNRTRLFFGPTGRSLKQGETYFAVYEFVMPFVQVGVTDRFSIGGGTPLYFGFDDSARPFWITPKLQIVNTGSTQIAVGAFHAFNIGDESAGVAYVVGTRSGAAGSFTAGAGVGYRRDGGRGGVVMIGGEGTIRKSIKLITENYIWEGGNGVASAGVRFFGERLSADVGLAIPLGVHEVYAFPIVNFVYLF